MYSQRLVNVLNTLAYKYKDIIERAIVAVLNQPKYKNTGAGAASLTVDVVDGDENKAPQILISFDDHILFLDKRKLQWTKQPSVTNLIEGWASNKTFDKVPGYKSNAIVDPAKAAARVAWAVAIDKKKNDTWKAKPWRKKSLSNVLKEMNQMILEGFDRAIQEDLTQAVKV